MIYLIGGAPKCGKTTLTKKLSKTLHVPWISSDSLQTVARAYISKYVTKKQFANLYPHNAAKGTNNDETYSRNTPQQIAKMINYYGKFFQTEAKKYNFPVLNMDKNFAEQLNKAIKLLSK